MNRLRKGNVRYSMGHILILVLGIAIGLIPYAAKKLTGRRPQQVTIDFRIFEADSTAVDLLGFQNSNGLILGTSIETIDEAITGLIEQERATLIANPTIVTSDGRPATVSSGTEIPITRGDCVEFKPIGISVTAVPTLLKNGNINLALNQSSNSIDRQDGVEPLHIRTENTQTLMELNDGDIFSLVAADFTADSTDDAKNRTIIVARVRHLRQE